ncbi:MAG: hypothetical protein ACJ716_03490 [Marmoricola sp.]
MSPVPGADSPPVDALSSPGGSVSVDAWAFSDSAARSGSVAGAVSGSVAGSAVRSPSDGTGAESPDGTGGDAPSADDGWAEVSESGGTFVAVRRRLVVFGDDDPAASEPTSSLLSIGAEAAAEADDPTASPCVVTGKACLIYTTQTTGTGRP